MTTKYFTKGEDVIAISEASSVHFDPASATEVAAAYLAWLAEGNTPEPWEATNGAE